MDDKTTLVRATEVGRQVEDAVHAAVPEARQVRWMPAATQAGSIATDEPG